MGNCAGLFSSSRGKGKDQAHPHGGPPGHRRRSSDDRGRRSSDDSDQHRPGRGHGNRKH